MHFKFLEKFSRVQRHVALLPHLVDKNTQLVSASGKVAF